MLHFVGRGCFVGLCLWATACGQLSSSAAAETPPNVLWITSEDHGPHLGCYGDGYATTPAIDALAARSLRFERCWSNAPVCAAARTTLITGMHATSLGAQHMRSGVALPAGIRLLPAIMRDAGYFCTNNSKTDYNFVEVDAGWNESGRNAHWRQRPDADVPFFSVFNFTETHESKIRSRPHTPIHDPALVALPAYHPDDPVVRRDWAQYYDRISEVDARVAAVLADLRRDGLADSTIVFFFSDHGSGMPRSKRSPLDSGLRVPLIVHVPERFHHLAPRAYRPGGVSSQLTSFVDLAPTVLSIAGAERPPTMQGQAFAGRSPGTPQEMLFGYRGRMGERVDMVRSCTDGRYVYVRNFYPELPHLKHVAYMFETPTTRRWKELFDAGGLNSAQAKFWRPRPVEELFDLQTDPDEVVNLAELPEHDLRLAEMRLAVQGWMARTGDLGLYPEPELARATSARPEGSRSPYQLGADPENQLSRAVVVAFETASRRGALGGADDLELLLKSDSALNRFWAARGVAAQAGTDDWFAVSGGLRLALAAAVDDRSPAVAIAACDALLRSNDSVYRPQAISRLVELADVRTAGDLAAVAALNVLDYNIRALRPEQIARIKSLPLKSQAKRARSDGCVEKLIAHITQD